MPDWSLYPSSGKKTKDPGAGKQCNSTKTSITVNYPCELCGCVYTVHSYFWMYSHSGCNYSWNAQESGHFQCGSSCCPDVSTASRREYTWRLALHHWAGTSPGADQTPLLRRIDLKGKLLPWTFTHDQGLTSTRYPTRPNFFFATQTRPELFFIISEFRVYLSKLFPSRPL